MKKNSKKLLLDLLKLRECYENKDIEEVIEVLQHNQDDYLMKVINLLNQLEQNPKPNDAKKQKGSAKNKSTFNLEDIKQLHLEKYKILTEIQKMLMSKEVFKTVKELQEFVSQKVVLTAAKNTKNQLIEKYLSLLISYSIKELESELTLLIERSNSSDDVQLFLDMANEIVNSRKEKRY